MPVIPKASNFKWSPKEDSFVGEIQAIMPAVLPVGPTNSNDSRDVSGAKEGNKECHLESHNLGALKFLEQGHINCSIELFSHNTAVDILLGPLRD